MNLKVRDITLYIKKSIVDLHFNISLTRRALAHGPHSVDVDRRLTQQTCSVAKPIHYTHTHFYKNKFRYVICTNINHLHLGGNDPMTHVRVHSFL